MTVMVFEYTPAVARALESAQKRARRDGSDEVRPFHVLAALLEDDEARVAGLLRDAGVDLETARTALQADAALDDTESHDPLPFTVQTQRLLRAAREPASLLSIDRSLPTDAVLIALLRQEDDLRRMLEQLGLRFDDLEQSLFPSTGPPLELEEPEVSSDQLSVISDQLRDESPRLGRLLDAVANRAREALRVLEDYTRFVLDDRLLSGELKQMRHDLTAVLRELPGEWLLAHRDTPGDVGTQITTESEGNRYDITDVVRAGCKRLQEALRSLEEFGKLHSPDLGAAVEQLRYRGYSLEQTLLLGTEARHRLERVRLMVLVTESLCRGSLEWTIREACGGGADAIQLREKQLNGRDLVERARMVRRWTREEGVLLVVNDRPDVAVWAEADAVHLGQQDVTVTDARRIVGPRLLIGVSTANLGQLQQAVRDGASYVGVGPAFPSQTKNFAKLAGLGYIREALAETSLPAFAIGGINAVTVADVVTAGARRIAVSQAVCGTDNPRRAVQMLRSIIDAEMTA
jgi:thiamine-phosphate pyrophosphorylase